MFQRMYSICHDILQKFSEVYILGQDICVLSIDDTSVKLFFSIMHCRSEHVRRLIELYFVVSMFMGFSFV